MCRYPQLKTDTDWDVSRKKGFRASIIVWGMPRDASTLEVRGKLADVGLGGFARGSVVWEGDHIRSNYRMREVRSRSCRS